MSEAKVVVNKVIEDGKPAEESAEKLPFTVRHSGVDTDEVTEPSDEIKANEVREDDLESPLDPYMAEAVRQGYDPEFEGEFKRSPREFVEHGKVLNTIHKQNQKIRDLEENARNQSSLIKQGMDKAREETIATLKAERREAREEGEWDKVDSIDEDIDSLKEEVVTPEVDTVEDVQPGPISLERAQQFAKDRPWMYTDVAAKDLAILKSNEYARAYPDASAEEIINYVDQEVGASRPDLYETVVTKPKPARMVAGQGRTARKPAGSPQQVKGTTYATLSAQEKRQCDLYVRSTGNTADQYCADLDLLG